MMLHVLKTTLMLHVLKQRLKSIYLWMH